MHENHVHLRSSQSAGAQCGRKNARFYTSTKSEVTCPGCRRAMYKTKVYPAHAVGIDVGSNKWVTSCDEHNTMIGSRTKKLAEEAARYPAEFCEECRNEEDRVEETP